MPTRLRHLFASVHLFVIYLFNSNGNITMSFKSSIELEHVTLEPNNNSHEFQKLHNICFLGKIYRIPLYINIQLHHFRSKSPRQFLKKHKNKKYE